MKNSDQPAMPTGNNQTGTGLTKREKFAAMAMQGLLTSDSDVTIQSICDDLGIEKFAYEWKKHYPQHIAMRGVLYADALLSELDKPVKEEGK